MQLFAKTKKRIKALYVEKWSFCGYNYVMPNDYITLKALSEELNDLLSDGRINKINMPSQDSVILQTRAKGTNRSLYITIAGTLPRLHLTDTKFLNPDVPPAFCMLLRKYLTNGAIEGVKTLYHDRIIDIAISATNELRDKEQYHLLTELMGGTSNIILTDGNYMIVDAVRRIFGDGERAILPNYTYKPPINSKTTVEDALLNGIPDSANALELFSTLLSGMAKETAREAAFYAETMSANEVLQHFLNLYGTPAFQPSVLTDGEGIPKCYYAMPYKTIKEGIWKPCATLNEAIDLYYSVSGSKAQKEKDTKELRALLKRTKQKFEKKAADNAQKLQESGKAEEFLRTAELIKSNIYQISKGQSILNCYDFYNNQETAIPLDPTLSPVKNAEVYYKKYNKLKGARLYAEKDKDYIDSVKTYLDSIETTIETSASPEEYREIEEELHALSGTPKQTNAAGKKKEKKSSPQTLKIDGYTVYIGKNNLQNDRVTFEIAEGGDLWLHVKSYHGSHVIIVCGGKEPPLSTIEKAASYAAYMSAARDSGKVEVDYTMRKFVKRLGKPGLVSYSKQKTILASPQKPEKQ